MTEHRDNDLVRRIVEAPVAIARDPSCALCAVCGSDAAALADCWSAGADQWVAQLRCALCGEWHELVISTPAMRRIESIVMAGWHAIERDASAFSRECMAAEADALMTAFEHDLIDANDFASPARIAGGRAG